MAISTRVHLARAQEINFQELAAEIARQRAASVGRYAALRKTLPVSEEHAKSDSTTSYTRRLDLAQSLVRVSTQIYPSDIQYKAPELLSPDTAYVVGHMNEAGVSAYPDPLDVTQDAFELLPEVGPVPIGDEWLVTNQPSKAAVVLDIFLDTFGLLPVRELVLDVLVQMDGFEQRQAAIREAIEKRDAEQIRDALFGLIEWFVEAKVCETVLKKLAEKKLAKLLLRNFAIRLVPFVGWGWCLLAFALAINRHWRLLVA
jgi:hypothetical protein